jgi:hypothetical protein
MDDDKNNESTKSTVSGTVTSTPDDRSVAANADKSNADKSNADKSNANTHTDNREASFWPRPARRTLQNITPDQHELVAAWNLESDSPIDSGSGSGPVTSPIRQQLVALLNDKQVKFTMLSVFSVEEQPPSPADAAEAKTKTTATLQIAVLPGSLSEAGAKDVIDSIYHLLHR